ncbi:MAG TPA: Mur ligase family protein, partial [Roseiflexaceae bacterium]|nr:Mur ligase family protein [Roseiflexaceae bacterium]
MRLHELLAGLPEARVSGPTDIEIASIAYDSRAVQPGGLFVAIRGFHTDGRAFIPQALERGAVAIIVDDPQLAIGDRGLGIGNFFSSQSRIPSPQSPTIVVVPDSRVALAPIAAVFYGYPAAAMRVVGITGTDGKTTTTFLSSAVLESSGRATGMIGTVDFKVGARQWANETRQSTPEAPEIQALLREMADAGCGYAVLESTSHALSARWNRLGGCMFDVALLTNVTHEHLDFHGSVEQYRRDKARLFEMLGETMDDGRWTMDDRPGESSSIVYRLSSKRRKVAIVNADDPHH